MGCVVGFLFLILMIVGFIYLRKKRSKNSQCTITFLSFLFILIKNEVIKNKKVIVSSSISMEQTSSPKKTNNLEAQTKKLTSIEQTENLIFREHKVFFPTNSPTNSPIIEETLMNTKLGFFFFLFFFFSIFFLPVFEHQFYLFFYKYVEISIPGFLLMEFHQVRVEEQLGKGGSALVFKGTFLDPALVQAHSTQQVALKKGRGFFFFFFFFSYCNYFVRYWFP